MINPVVDEYGNKHWYDKHGRHHRDDGPAIIGRYGYKVWCQNGRLHRIDGPAVINRCGIYEYWVNGGQCKSLEDVLYKLMDHALQ